MRLGEGAVFKAEKVKKTLLIIYAPLEGFLGLGRGAVFKAEKVKKTLLIIYAPLEGFLRGFDQGCL